jgi:hypothetical protein
LLAHLGEVEARGIHRTRACSSLYTYCIYELRFSEDEAFRRVAAARLVRRFPALWDAVAAGELHLTGLLMLGPHLTEQNLSEVLRRAKHRTKKEIARLVRQLDPLPDVPARIEPLGPAPARVTPSEPTWDEFVTSLRPVRELAPGERPRDWTANANDVDAETAPPTEPQAHAPPGMLTAESFVGADLPAPLLPERYRVQFTAREEYVKLIEEARALLSRSAPRATLDEIQLRAMRALVAELKRKKYAVTARPKKPCRATSTGAEPADVGSSTTIGLDTASSPTAELAAAGSSTAELAAANSSSAEFDAAGSPSAEFDAAGSPSAEFDAAETPAAHAQAHATAEREPESAQNSETKSLPPRRRGRRVPASVRRAVFERDEGRCTYADGTGRRCAETHGLELHHVRAFARGGEHTEANLTLRCRSHNALAAEEDFGRERIEFARGASEHEAWAEHAGG